MPYRIVWEPRGVYRIYHGNLTDAQRRRSLEKICSDSRFDSLRYAITDFLAVEHFAEDPEATLELAALNLAPLLTNPRLILAAVAIHSTHIEYVRRVKALRFFDAPYEVFPTLEAAREWVFSRTGIPTSSQCAPAAGGSWRAAAFVRLPWFTARCRLATSCPTLRQSLAAMTPAEA